MIKKAGKVYCIKDYVELNICQFFKNKTYDVINVNGYTFSIIGENKMTLSFNKYSPFNQYNIPDHFVSLKEYRKLKLEKIQNIKNDH